jgi:hypothetical protein
MDPLGTNPFGVLTFIVAPAILTNATSVMLLSTGNRFGLAIDRVKTIMADLDARQAELGDTTSVRVERLKMAHQRVVLLVRALTALYFGVGSFVTATLLSLTGAIMFATGMLTPHRIALAVSITAGVAGVLGLVRACWLFIRESRLARQLLDEEIDLKFKIKYSRIGKASH